MARTVIQFQPFETEEATVFSLWDPRNSPEATITKKLSVQSNKPPFTQLSGDLAPHPDMVRMAGESLYNGIIEQPAIRERLRSILNANEPSPIYILIDNCAEAERFPWEALCKPGSGFMALDDRWQIARMVGPPASGQVELLFTPPLQMLAFLAATGVSARPEWEALYGALRQSGIAVKLTVYVCEQDLYDTIVALKRNPPRDSKVQVSVGFVKPNFDPLEAFPKRSATPHIIHFFCHGSSQNGGEIYVANEQDWRNGLRGTAIVPRDFYPGPGKSSPWLVTLNCCKSGEAVDAQSFARTLVQEGYAQAAIGMRESVDAEAANKFCDAFYTVLLGQIADLITRPSAQPAGASYLDLASTLQVPRRRICELRSLALGTDWRTVAATSKEWTLPVLYSQPKSYMLKIVKRKARTRARATELDHLRGYLEGLIDKREELTKLGVPGDALAGLDAEINSVKQKLMV